MQRTKVPLAFLLAQVGAHAAMRFGERLSHLKLTPPDAGILQMLSATGGLSQQELSARLGIHPSRLVAILDTLEEQRLVERRPELALRLLVSIIDGVPKLMSARHIP